MIEISVVERRLLLAKEFYLNAIELTKETSGLNHILAIHNFHASVEIVLKAILIKFDIRTEKMMNIGFEQLMADIDKHQSLKDKQLRLPLRQEMSNLNQHRNLAQHHATEPSESALMDCRVFVGRFLSETFDRYFQLSFEDVSRISSINNPSLQVMAKSAHTALLSGNYTNAVCILAAAFRYAEQSIFEFLPSEGLNSIFFVGAGLRNKGLDYEPLTEALKKTHERIKESEQFTAVVGSGVSLSQLKHFRQATPHVAISLAGTPIFNSRTSQEYSQKDAEFAEDFVIACLIHWQTLGLEPQVPKLLQEGAKAFIDKLLKQ